MKKRFGKLTTVQFREFIARVPELLRAQEELQSHFASLPEERLEALLAPAFNWAEVYELPFHEHLALAIAALNLGGFVSGIAADEDPQQRLLEAFDSDLVEAHHPAFDQGVVVGLVVSLGKTLASFMVHGRSLSSLVASVREDRDLDALFEVVRIDRAALSCPTIASCVARAELLDDQKFFSRLRNALKGPSKKRWGGRYHKMRYALALLRELGVDDLSTEELEQLFVRDIGAYADVPAAGKNLRAQYQRSRKVKTI
jgi:hypothetical protein